MKLQLLYSLIIFWLAFGASYAALSPEVYWKVKLPHTSIPEVIKDSIPKAEDAAVELKQDNTNTNEKIYHGLHAFGAWTYHDATEDEIRELTGENPQGNTNNFLYKPFFLENDLEKGKNINFPSLKSKNGAPFLPRQFAESIPYSSQKLQEILNYFSIDSPRDVRAIKDTLQRCEDPVMRGERKLCATSLESMVDFIVSMFKTNNIQAITTEVQGEAPALQRYTIEGVELIADGINVICHKLKYVYAVHFCHGGGIINTYMVSMVGADGTKVKAVSVCHKDTSLWNPKGLPFVVLEEVKPGTTSICHFLNDDQILLLDSKETSELSVN